MLGDNTFEQLFEEDMFWQNDKDINSIAFIVKYFHGNMFSRWTDFLSIDGEKDWRDREGEFESSFSTKKEVLDKWNEGWQCVFDALESVNEKNVDTIVYIRNQGHKVEEACIRQLAHYASHVGQIIYIGRMLRGKYWQSLFIPKGDSKAFNQTKFAKEK